MVVVGVKRREGKETAVLCTGVTIYSNGTLALCYLASVVRRLSTAFFCGEIKRGY